MAAVPRARSVILSESVLASYICIGEQTVDAFVELPLGQELHAHGTAITIESHRLVPHHTEVGPEVGEGHTRRQADGRPIVPLHEALQSQRGVPLGPVVAQAEYSLVTTLVTRSRTIDPLTVLLVAKDEVARQLEVAPHICIEAPPRRETPPHRHPRAQLAQRIGHRLIDFVAIHTDAAAQRDAAVRERLRRLDEPAVLVQVEGALEIHRDQCVLQEEIPLRVGAVVEPCEFILGTPCHLQTVRAVLPALQTELVLHLLGQVVQGQGQGLIVVDVLVCPVAEHVAARHPCPSAVLGEAVVFDPHRVVPLLVDLEGVEDGHLVQVILRRGILRRGEVQLKIVIGPYSQDGQPLVRRRLIHPLELEVVINR